MECDLKREIERDSLSHDAPQYEHRNERIRRGSSSNAWMPPARFRYLLHLRYLTRIRAAS